MTPQSFSSSLIAIFLTSAVAYAGAGANGGQGFVNQLDSLQLVYGTISPSSGSPFDFLATDANINLLLSDFTTGGDSLSPPTSLDPRVLAGTAGLLTSPTVPYTAFFTKPGGGTESITMEFAAQEVDNIWFSNGALGQISAADLTDASQILAVAESLGVFGGGGSPSSISSTSAGTYPFTNTTIQDVNMPPAQAVVLNVEISLTELDFSAGSTSVPEPSQAWIIGIGLASVAIYRKRLQRR